MGRWAVMGTWVVERYLAGWDRREIDDLVLQVQGGRELFNSFGVCHLRSIAIADDETCLCVFSGPDAETVRAANAAADLPVHRIVAAHETTDELERRP